MINSMTGFGRCEAVSDSKKVSVEIKSVNHRYLDLNIKIPRLFNALEADIRQLLKNRILRGKVDIYISYEDNMDTAVSVEYNKGLAGEYLKHLRQMAEDYGLDNDVRVSHLSRYADVLTIKDVPMDEAAWSELINEAVTGACDRFLEARAAEGQQLYKDINDKLDTILGYVAAVEERSPEIVAEYRQKIEEKVAELLGDRQIDENRLATEVVLFADKICTDEETVRLKSHVKSMADTLKCEGSIGRKLDFIAQEMNREANTILSKSNDKIVSDIAINLKTEIEKVREQIQNIE